MEYSFPDSFFNWDSTAPNNAFDDDFFGSPILDKHFSLGDEKLEDVFPSMDFEIPNPVQHKRVPSSPVPINLPLFMMGNSNISADPRPPQIKHNRQRSVPPPNLQSFAASSIMAKSMADALMPLNPRSLGFIPVDCWKDEELTIRQLISSFFQRKNNKNCRFSHKLYNALKITSQYPEYYSIVGVKWLSDTIVQVDKLIFATLLGIRSIDGSLFHSQGNFPSHGFQELSHSEAIVVCNGLDISSVDFDTVRLFIHQGGLFTKSCSESEIELCKWNGVAK